MNKIKSVIKIMLKTSTCNIVIKNGHIGRWYFDWNNNLITAYTYLKYDIENPIDIFDKTRTVTDLALLIDTLTLITNQDINTSIVISTEPIIDSFIGNVIFESKSVDQFCFEIKNLKHQSNASSLNSSDYRRIDTHSSLHLSDKDLTIINLLLSKE